MTEQERDERDARLEAWLVAEGWFLRAPQFKADIRSLLDDERELREALAAIADGDKECGCEDHNSPDCCVQAGAFCPFCIASRALAGEVSR